MSRLKNQDGFERDEKPDSETVRRKNAGLREKKRVFALKDAHIKN